ncbi:MAG: sigma-54 dependent transcriptional regulator [Planctomycetota bacterium]|jgi:DNA-binding NtrC family response regulator|nr:sigma-54 dependent transcriptional regulator [Planctomycetota bacterium]
MPRRILILDTPKGDLSQLKETFAEAAGAASEVVLVRGIKKCLDAISGPPRCDLVVIDIDLGDGRAGGATVLKRLKKRHPDLPVIAVAERGTIDSASEAIKAGASDFLVRGRNLHTRVTTLFGKVKQMLRVIDDNRRLRLQNQHLQEADADRFQILGGSLEILELVDRIQLVAPIPRPVLITGERGTGKELVARAIHTAAGDPGRPLVVVNCAAFTDSLLENELFGHEKGAFTGAIEARAGKFELANGGTLFLDEIGNMSLQFQSKILRVVEYGSFTRVGGDMEIRSDARVIAATNVDLEAKIESGGFLADLYDRLAFEVIHIPPLRERPDDIERLARHFWLHILMELPSARGKTLSGKAIEALKRYSFPGNVRELKNMIERAAYRDTPNEVTPQDLGIVPAKGVRIPGGDFDKRVGAFKRQLVMDALEAASGNQAQAARALGLSYHQFRYYYGKYRDAD